MSQNLVILAEAAALKLALAGGRAPRYWQRLLTQKTAALASLHRSSAWPLPLLATRPTLQDGPLFGERLAAVTRASADADEASATEPTPRQRGAAAARRSPERTSRRALARRQGRASSARGSSSPGASSPGASSPGASSPGASSAGASPPGASSLGVASARGRLPLPPAQPVAETKLRRLAGDLPVLGVRTQARIGLPTTGAPSQQRLVFRAAEKPSAGEQWLQAMVQGVDRKLVRSNMALGQTQQTAANTPTQDRAALMRTWSQPFGAAEISAASAQLALFAKIDDELAQPISTARADTPSSKQPAPNYAELDTDNPRPTVPPGRAMHERLAQKPAFVRTGQPAGRRRLRLPAPPIDLSALLERLIGLETGDQNGAGQRHGRTRANAGAGRSAGVKQPSPGRAGSDTPLAALDKPASSADALAARSHDGRNMLAAAFSDWASPGPWSADPAANLHDAEAAETPLRPPLLPLRPLRSTPGGMTPAGKANVVVQADESQGVGAQAGEELDALAAKIKRILDEEARRHGIDV